MANNNHFSTLEPVWEIHRPYVEMLSRMTGSLIFARGMGRGPYYFLSPDFAHLGLDVPKEKRSPDPGFLEARMHPDDLSAFGNVIDRLYHEFISGLPPEEQKEYKHIFEFRAVNKAGEWVRLISQHQIIDHDPNGNQLLLGAIDISPDQTPGTSLRFTLANIKTGEIVPFDIHKEPGTELTRREKEVLRLIEEGKYSKEISDRLRISIHTVNRHRQNILEKMQVNNAREAIRYARRQGLLA
jgi:DNA-binding CsgD family transcriptional regulator